MTDYRSIAESLRREIAFACRADGVIEWSCERAIALGLRAGTKLRDAVVATSCAQVDDLLARTTEGSEIEVDAVLRGGGAARAFTFRCTRKSGAVVIVAVEVPERLATASDRLDVESARHKAELASIARALADSNRGVLSLYAELDESSASLRRASEVKARVLSNVSHEFRTPLNSILGLSKLLLDRADGELTSEQEKQVRYIRSAADALSNLVNDMLDLSRAESGRAGVRLTRFSASDLFSSMRGTMRPLVLDPNVELVFEPLTKDFTLDTDEGKVAQILRNLVSNALKFTEKGSVRVRAAQREEGKAVFEVVDTGVGILPDHVDLIFEEFAQVDGPLQRKWKGTGLGLSISRRLAGILGGDLTVKSTFGKGSTFTLTLPAHHPEAQDMGALIERSQHLDPERAPVLVLEDDRQSLFLYEKYLAGSGFQVLPARSVDEARAQLARVKPSAVVLDIMLESETSWTFLHELKTNEETRDIPTLVVTVTNREQQARALGADEFWLKPVDRTQLLSKLNQLARTGPMRKVLLIDDDEVSRYVLRRHLSDTRYEVLEAPTGPEGVSRARSESPDVILLDFVLPDMTAFDVIDELKTDPRTRFIPVVVYTGKALDAEERARLERETTGILNKQSLSREVAIGRIRDALVKAGINPSGGRYRELLEEPRHG